MAGFVVNHRKVKMRVRLNCDFKMKNWDKNKQEWDVICIANGSIGHVVSETKHQMNDITIKSYTIFFEGPYTNIKRIHVMESMIDMLDGPGTVHSVNINKAKKKGIGI